MWVGLTQSAGGLYKIKIALSRKRWSCQTTGLPPTLQIPTAAIAYATNLGLTKSPQPCESNLWNEFCKAVDILATALREPDVVSWGNQTTPASLSGWLGRTSAVALESFRPAIAARSTLLKPKTRGNVHLMCPSWTSSFLKWKQWKPRTFRSTLGAGSIAQG